MWLVVKNNIHIYAMYIFHLKFSHEKIFIEARSDLTNSSSQGFHAVIKLFLSENKKLAEI